MSVSKYRQGTFQTNGVCNTVNRPYLNIQIFQGAMTSAAKNGIEVIFLTAVAVYGD